jgi:hypothetical protein
MAMVVCFQAKPPLFWALKPKGLNLQQERLGFMV